MRPCHFFLRLKGDLGIGHQVVFLFHRCLTFATSTSYAVDDISEGAREVIRDLNGSLRSRHFLYVMNESTSFFFRNVTRFSFN